MMAKNISSNSRLAFTVILTNLVLVNLVDGGAQTSKQSEPIDGLLDNLSLIDLNPELLSMVGDGNFFQFPIAKPSKMPKVEKLRSAIFILGEKLVTMDRANLEHNLAKLLKLLDDQRMMLATEDLEFKKEVQLIYTLSSSIKRDHCNQNEGLFFDRLEAMALKYKPFPNVHNYINQIHRTQLLYCRTLFDVLLLQAKGLLNRRSVAEASIFSDLYEKVKYEITIEGDEDEHELGSTPRSIFEPTSRKLRLKSMTRNVDFRRLVEATSLYLLHQLDSEDLAKSRLARECSRIIQSQLHYLDHSCTVIRDAFSGLARVHNRLAGLKKDLELTQIPGSPPRAISEQETSNWFKMAHSCDAAKGVIRMSEPIERAYKLRVLISKFPAALLEGKNAEAKLKWRDLKLKLYSSDRANRMEPIMTLNALRALRRIENDTDLGNNIYFRDIVDEVQLVDMSYALDTRCLSGFFDKFENIYGKFAQFTVNIEPYLAYYYRKQIALCNEIFATLLEQVAQPNRIESSFSPTANEILDSLTDAFSRLTKQSLANWIDQKHLLDSVSFYRFMAFHLKDSAGPKKKFESVEQACRELDNGHLLVPLLDLYDRIRDETKKPLFIGDENSNGVRWLFKARICSHIEFVNWSHDLANLA